MSTQPRFVARNVLATRSQLLALRGRSRRGRIELPLIVGTLLAAVALTQALPLVRPARGAPESGGPALGQAASVEVTDTVTLWQQTFTTPSGADTQFVESVVFPTGSYQYTLRVEKGPIALTKADVFFDGLQVASLADVTATGTVERVINATGTQSSVVTRVAGSAGASATVSVRQLADPTWLIFGPRLYPRSSQFLVDTFSMSHPAAGVPWYAHVTNGPPGSQRAQTLQLQLNGIDLPVPSEFGPDVAGFVVQLPSVLGPKILGAKVGGSGQAAVSITVRATDSLPPQLAFNPPLPGVTTEPEFSIGVVDIDHTAVDVWVNAQFAALNGANLIHGPVLVPLTEGSNLITVHATDAAGNTTDSVRSVIRDSQAPELTVLAPAEGLITAEATLAVSGTVSDATDVTVNVNGAPLTVQAGSFAGSVALSMGLNVLSFAATDVAGRVTTVVRQVTRTEEEPPSVPPDPATVAPPLDRTVAAAMVVATEFLYTGANPIQTGVAPGTIDPERVAVLKGKVSTRDGSALGGVEITILDHPELGQTLTRTDGAFDIAVNGGSLLTVNYRKDGFLPIQREVNAPWQDYALLDDVVMIPFDTAVTGIDFSASMQVARGSVVTDADGTRRATLMFPQGTQATMVMPDGSTQPLSSISVRATEYTVGENGPKAMPGLLPSTSGYTYAAELSVDEAVAAGGTEVRFDQPVPVYIENFIGHPVGTRVPVASYDRTKSAWVPSADGKVIKVLGTSGGLATIGLDTTGMAADSAALAALGITDAERQQIASLYSAGQTLWRMPVRHFSPFDGNYPAGNPPGATDPNQKQTRLSDRCATEKPGYSSVECTNQVLGEELPITGTPITLTYRSDRTPGYRAARRQEIRLTGDTVPPSLQRVELVLEVAGRRFTQTFPPTPNQRFTFEWDGKDSYGRAVTGAQPLTIRIGYTYPMLYLVPAQDAASFGLLCYGAPEETFWDACVIPSARNTSARLESTRWSSQQLMVGGMDVTPQGEGGWTVDVHHAYDPNARVLYYGHGRERDARDVVTTVAGTGVLGTSGDGGPATQAQLWDPTAIAVGSDRTVYFVDRSHRLRKVRPDGTITTIAGTGVFGYTGDGGPATEARIQWGDLGSMALGPDGSIYLAQPNFGVVRKIAPDGIITTVAGNSAIGFCTGDGEDSDSLFARLACVRDGFPATEASLWGPYGVAVAPDGSIYIADGNHTVRKVSPDGIISTIAGGGHASYPCDYSDTGSPWVSRPQCGDGGAARLAGFDTPRALAVGPDGSVYVTEFGNASVRRISPDGIVTRVVGVGRPFGFAGDGGLAVNAQMLSAGGLAVGEDGTLYIADGNHRFRRVSPDGIVTTVAGTGATAPQCGQVTPPTCTTDGLGTQTALNIKGPIALGPDGSIYFGTFLGDHRIRRLVPFFRSFNAEGFVISSEDGGELYEFDPRGRHLRTRDALTKRILFSFAYDAQGRLSEVADADSNVTRLERNGAGELTAVVSPFGQRTAIGFDARGWLARLVNPAGDTTRVEHDSTGLLVSLTDPKGNPPHRFFYDSLGLLTRDEDGAGGSLTVSRALTDTSIVATTTSAMGRVEKSGIHFLSTGAVVRTEVDAAGLVTRTEEATNGTTTVSTPDSSVATMTERPDPRFGMQAPVSSTFSLRTPSGLQLTRSGFRRATLADPSDPLSLATQTDSLVVNGRSFKSVFDAAVRTLSQTSAEGRQTVTQLDPLGRVVEERVPGVAPVRYGYGPRGFLTTITQAGRTLRYDYDSSGRVSKVTDPLGRFEQYAYDSVGRVVKQTLFNGSETLYGYDANGNLTSLTPPGRPAHTFAYTAANLDSVYTPPAAGLANPATRYTFNLDRQLTRVLRPDSLAIDVAYDTAGRPKTLTLPNGQVQFAYSPTSGNLTTLTAVDGGTLTYTYDGSLPTSATWAGAVQGRVGFKYNSDFRVSEIAVNGTDSVAFGYDRDNLLTSAGAMTITRDPQNGRVIRTVLASDTSTWMYDDSTGAVSRYIAKHGATTLFDVIYTRDSLERIVQMVETVQGVTATKTFTYDSLGRLDQVRVDSVLVSDYGYDPNGNRTSLTTQSGTVTGTYDNQDRMLTYGGAAYAYTADGELTLMVASTDTTRYTYDVLGNLTKVRLPDGTLVEYLIDAQNRRVGKTVNGVLVQGLLYQGQLAPIAELDGNGQLISRFVYGSHANTPDYMIRGSVAFRFVTDHLGTVRLVVNAVTGSIAQRIDYDEHGLPLQDTNPGFQPFGFGGGLVDGLTRLVRFGSRDFDARSGRWTIRDPLGFRSGSSNLYTYAFEDPINFIDPRGEQGIWGAVGGAGLEFGIELWSNDWRIECVDWRAVARGGIAGSLGTAWLKGAFRLSKSTKYGPALREYRKLHSIPGKRSPDYQEIHHWFFENRGPIGRHVPDWIKNQPWNFNPLPKAVHDNITHGRYGPLERWWRGTPDWAKGLEVSGAGYVLGRTNDCGC